MFSTENISRGMYEGGRNPFSCVDKPALRRHCDGRRHWAAVPQIKSSEKAFASIAARRFRASCAGPNNWEWKTDMTKFVDIRPVNKKLKTAFEPHLSERYRTAAVKVMKIVHNSGLSLHEQFDLVSNQLYFLMLRSPQGFADEFTAFKGHLETFPDTYLEDVERGILDHRIRKLVPPSRNEKFDHERWFDEPFAKEGPMHPKLQERFVIAMRQVLDGLYPRAGISAVGVDSVSSALRCGRGGKTDSLCGRLCGGVHEGSD
jgi:hypothetical protein